MPVKSTRFKTQTIFDGEITGLNEREKNVFRKAGIGGTPENVLVTPTGLIKTKLVGVGTNGQENIEIGDNLTLANGKLSATGGGSGGTKVCIIKVNRDDFSYTSNIPLPTDGSTPVFADIPGFYDCIYPVGYSYETDEEGAHVVSIMSVDTGDFIYGKLKADGTLGDVSYEAYKHYYHFITMTNSTDNIALYLVIQNSESDAYSADRLDYYLAGKKVLANGNLHGVVPTYIAGEGGVIKIYYRTPGDSNINPTPDEYQDLSSFTITDLVSPVE